MGFKVGLKCKKWPFWPFLFSNWCNILASVESCGIMWNTNLTFFDQLHHYQNIEIGFRLELSGTRNYFHKMWYFCRFLGLNLIKFTFLQFKKQLVQLFCQFWMIWWTKQLKKSLTMKSKPSYNFTIKIPYLHVLKNLGALWRVNFCNLRPHRAVQSEGLIFEGIFFVFAHTLSCWIWIQAKHYFVASVLFLPSCKIDRSQRPPRTSKMKRHVKTTTSINLFREKSHL